MLMIVASSKRCLLFRIEVKVPAVSWSEVVVPALPSLDVAGSCRAIHLTIIVQISSCATGIRNRFSVPMVCTSPRDTAPARRPPRVPPLKIGPNRRFA